MTERIPSPAQISAYHSRTDEAYKGEDIVTRASIAAVVTLCGTGVISIGALIDQVLPKVSDSRVNRLLAGISTTTKLFGTILAVPGLIAVSYYALALRRSDSNYNRLTQIVEGGSER